MRLTPEQDRGRIDEASEAEASEAEVRDPADRIRHDRFGTLPDPVRPEDTVAAQEAVISPDPAFAAGADTDWVLRHAG